MEETEDKTFRGDIKDGAKHCFVSFPGKFASAWDALIHEEAVHSESIACVFLCTPEDGLGKHEPDPLRPEICYCKTIYGERTAKEFGYFKILPRGFTPDQEEKARKKAAFTNTVVVREDASTEEKEAAVEEAEQAWERNGRIAAWGCRWFQVWKEKVEEAVRQEQTLKVVFFPGQVGQGKVAWKDLATVPDLWDGIGCGGSQKCEVAYLDMMQEKCGQDWHYEGVDVVNFLKNEFAKGKVVNAFDGKQWCRGELLARPTLVSRSKPSPEDPNKKEQVLQCRVQSHGKVFTTERVRHRDDIQKLLHSVGKDQFWEIVKQILPDDVKIVRHEDSILPNGTDCLQAEIQVETVESNARAPQRNSESQFRD